MVLYLKLHWDEGRKQDHELVIFNSKLFTSSWLFCLLFLSLSAASENYPLLLWRFATSLDDFVNNGHVGRNLLASRFISKGLWLKGKCQNMCGFILSCHSEGYTHIELFSFTYTLLILFSLYIGSRKICLILTWRKIAIGWAYRLKPGLCQCPWA